MPEIERKYDIVVIGHAREDRKKIIKNSIMNAGEQGVTYRILQYCSYIIFDTILRILSTEVV